VTGPLFLRHAAGDCRIELVPDLPADPVRLLAAIPPESRAFLLTEATVDDLWGDPVRSALAAAGVEVQTVILSGGEERKNLEAVSGALDEMLDAGIRRDDRVLALGGGVLGDEAALAAALALRGVPVIQIPTTLLAMVDSSIGGKTGVNHSTGKNRIGVFSQPEVVLISPAFLETLPPRQLAAGLFEALKSAFLDGENAIAGIESFLASKTRSIRSLGPILENAVRLKVRIVEGDERESGGRQLLNFGHTFAHALEAATGYRRFLHGEAVGWGMVAALRLSVELGRLDSQSARRFTSAIDEIGSRPPVDDLDFGRLEPFLASDKKVRSRSGAVWVILAGAGKGELVEGVEPAVLRKVWSATQLGTRS